MVTTAITKLIGMVISKAKLENKMSKSLFTYRAYIVLLTTTLFDTSFAWERLLSARYVAKTALSASVKILSLSDCALGPTSLLIGRLFFYRGFEALKKGLLCRTLLAFSERTRSLVIKTTLSRMKLT